MRNLPCPSVVKLPIASPVSLTTAKEAFASGVGRSVTASRVIRGGVGLIRMTPSMPLADVASLCARPQQFSTAAASPKMASFRGGIVD